MRIRSVALTLVLGMGAALLAAPAGALGPKDLMPVTKNTSAVAEERLDHLAGILHKAYDEDGPEGMKVAVEICYDRWVAKAANDRKKAGAVECFLLDQAAETLYQIFVNKMANQGRPVAEPDAYFVDEQTRESRRAYNVLTAFAENEAELFASAVGNGSPGIVIRVHNLRARDRIATDAAPLRTIRFSEARLTSIADYYWRTFRDHGMIGVEAGISGCYEAVSRAREKRKSRLASCLALDLTGELLDQGRLELMASMKLPAEPFEFFDEAIMIERRARYFDAIFPLDELADWMGDVADEVIRRISVLQTKRDGSAGDEGGARR